MEEKLFELIYSTIREDEDSLDKKNVPKHILVNAIYDVVKDEISDDGAIVTKNNLDGIVSMQYISIVSKKLRVDPHFASEILHYVDKIEIYPRTDNLFQMNLIFYNLYSKSNRGCSEK